jgi:IPT/TIG domain
MKRCFLVCFLIFSLADPQFSRGLTNRPVASQHSFCGTHHDRVRDELQRSRDLRRVIEFRFSRRELTVVAGATQDIGQIAVIEDDGTIVSPQNPFDLPAQTLRLSPEGATGNYHLAQRAETLGSQFGTQLTLTDDDSREITFNGNFRFPFFGTAYSSVFVNSDGNLTFGQGDSASTARDLTRFNSGPPRIGGFFADLDPTTGRGAVFVNALADRFLVTWSRIQEFGGSMESSFQIVLFPDGAFELVYGGIAAGSGIAGWSGGRDVETLGLVDLSASAGLLLSGPKAERFAQFTEVELSALARKFYQTHGDDYDQLVMFTNFPFNLDGAFAFEMNLKNEIRGINVPLEDFSATFGSQGNLESFLTMNELAAYPDDPDAIFLGTNSAVNILGHEAGHRWLAYVRFRDNNGQDSTDLLGRDQAHWSFFFNSEASVLEGNEIQDLGNGIFRTVAATDRYSRLDQYLMGLREAFQVAPLFYVNNTGGTSTTPSSPPALGVSFTGTRQELTVDDIIEAEGPRIPAVAASPKVFRQAFILLARGGTAPSSAEIDKLNRLRQRWQEFFLQATDSLGSVETSLDGVPAIPILSGLTPSSGSTLGNTLIYITGNDFQEGATVRVGDSAATTVQVVTPSLITAKTPAGPEGMVPVTVTNPGALPATLSNAFTYRSLNPAAVSAGVLRVAFALDNLSFRSNLGINNPNPVSANVRVLHLDSSGLVVNELASLTIAPEGYTQRNSILRELEGVTSITGREGSLVLESSQPLQAFVSQINNQTGDPSILEGLRQGASRLILQSAANTGPFRSNLLVSNLASAEARVNLTALDRDTGQPLGTPIQNLAIPGNGFVSYENILAALNVNDSFGPVEIHSLDSTPLAAVSRVSGVSAGTSGFFPAQPTDSGQLLEFIPFVIDTGAFRTNLGINNLGTAPASVNVSFIGSDGMLLAATPSPVPVAPQGLVQINNVLRFLLAGSSNAPVTGQQGYLRITADVPIKAYATQIDNVSNDPSIETSVSRGGAHLLLQSAANTNFRSTLVVVNPSTSPVTVSILAREGGASNNGTVTGTRTITIPGHGQYVSESVLQEIGATSAYGPVEIRSLNGTPIIAVSRVYSTVGNTSGFFSAQSLPE